MVDAVVRELRDFLFFFFLFTPLFNLHSSSGFSSTAAVAVHRLLLLLVAGSA
jgi:hypothetical protein